MTTIVNVWVQTNKDVQYAPAVCTCTVCVHMYIVDISYIYRSVHDACKEMLLCVYIQQSIPSLFSHIW